MTKLLIPALCAAFATSALAEDAKFNLTEITCFEVISLPEEDSLFLTGLLLGFKNGMAGTADASVVTIKAAVEPTDATSGNDPDMKALGALS